ncbi:MAG: hypothetical protein ABEJ56_00515 [Candidatus Nanohaloarchaea archaeon]
MRNYFITILGTLSIILSASPLALKFTDTGMGFISALGTIAAYLILGYNRKLILKEGRNTWRKVVESVSNLMVPVIAVSTVSLHSSVTRLVGLFSLASISLAMLLNREISSRMSKNYGLRLGEKVWIGILALGILLTYLNSFYLFYAVLMVGIVGFLDSLELIRKVIRD